MSGIWMAKEIGAFERNGLTADLVHISSGATSIQALVGGSVQAAWGASNAVVAATVKGAPIIAVASNTSRPGMQLWVQPEIQRAEQLQGKTLAITRFGSTSDFVTRLVLRKLNLEGNTELRQGEKYMGQRGGSSELHYEFVSKYLDAVPRVDPAAVDTVLEMVGSKGAPKAKLFDNSIVDRLVQEGFIDKLYKGTKP